MGYGVGENLFNLDFFYWILYLYNLIWGELKGYIIKDLRNLFRNGRDWKSKRDLEVWLRKILKNFKIEENLRRRFKLEEKF